MQKNALITGGAGFIGSHLADRLLAEGYTVTALDNLSTGSYSNIDHLKSETRFKLVVADVTDKEPLGTLISDADIVYHLAAAVGVRLIIEQPLVSMSTNIKGTESVLELANHWRKPVLIASTSEVYGKNRKLPFCEDDDIVFGSTSSTRWCYACSKAIDEFLAIAYYRNNGLPATVVRYFNTSGPRQTGHYGMVVPTFVRQALAGQPLTVHGDGSQRRTFTHVLDAVDATYRLSICPDSVGQVCNIGGNAEISILELASLIKHKTSSDSEIQLVAYEDAFGAGLFEDVSQRIPCLSRLDSFIGYKPNYSIDDIIDSVIEHTRQNPGFD